MTQPLPDYQVRISQRAKHARLVIKSSGVLEVVLPMNMNHDDADKIVRNQRAWISKHQQKIKIEQSTNELVDMRPNSIYFPLFEKTIAIQYRESDHNSYQENDCGLTVLFSRDDMVSKILQHWLKHQAKRYLPSALFAISQEMGETYLSVSVRLQKTRWGSCSNQRRINLNAKLLLLPEDLMRYVMVHELSHLQHLNHSPKFWQRVAEFDSEYEEKRQQLRVWSRQMPHWLIIE